MEFKERLNIINKELSELIKKHKPDFAGVEKLYFCKKASIIMK
jgi:Holliday junction resolvasome RuvABC endonuclease subunit